MNLEDLDWHVQEPHISDQWSPKDSIRVMAPHDLYGWGQTVAAVAPIQKDDGTFDTEAQRRIAQLIADAPRTALELKRIKSAFKDLLGSLAYDYTTDAIRRAGDALEDGQ